MIECMECGKEVSSHSRSDARECNRKYYDSIRNEAQQEIINKLLELVRNLEGYTNLTIFSAEGYTNLTYSDKYGFKDDDLISSSDGT